MTVTGSVRCRSSHCGRTIFLAPEDWVALEEDLSPWDGVRVRCPDCGLTFVYSADDLVEPDEGLLLAVDSQPSGQPV
ncbi:MAG TPA: hypothetical protein VEY07_00565 [Thermoplasmata archaeon]|nr:hypothetical protein [Thermoplasmata archaeon]